MIELVDFQDINVLPQSDLQVVSSMHTSVSQINGKPLYIVLNISINKYIAEADNCEFPIYLPAQFNYLSNNHIKLLDIFRSGEIFVTVNCKNLKIFREQQDNNYKYWGYAYTFQVVEDCL